jgi:hypothetical protein
MWSMTVMHREPVGPSDESVAANILPRQEPDEDDEEDEGDGREEDDDNEGTDRGYSERSQ